MREAPFDVLVLGAGPGGCAAAIAARAAGCSVVVLEARRGPVPSPGETLHPGIEGLFAQLGVQEAFLAAGFHRHRGIWLERGEERLFHAYGEDANGPWLGFQADRRILQDILQERVLETGSELLLGSPVEEVLLDEGRVVGVKSGGRELRATFTLDATGRRAFLAQRLGIAAVRRSPPLRVRFGWRPIAPTTAGGDTEAEPVFVFGEKGWSWRARVGLEREAWVELRRGDSAERGQNEPGLDSSWYFRPACAGPGYFLLGDAALCLDPSSSHGVLRALLSGLLGSHLIKACLAGATDEKKATDFYRQWTRDQLEHDEKRLRAVYAAASPGFFSEAGA